MPRDEIDKRYMDRPYYIAPTGKVGAEAFAVIREAMRDKGRVALAGVVMANREHVIALDPLLREAAWDNVGYDYEVRDAKPYFSDIPNVRIAKDMLKLLFISWKPRLLTSIRRHSRTSMRLRCASSCRRRPPERRSRSRKSVEKPSNVINLMDALRQSIKSADQRTPRRRARRGATRSRKAA